jgi:hypothetical protein
MGALRRFAVGAPPQPVTPAYDLRALSMGNDHQLMKAPAAEP